MPQQNIILFIGCGLWLVNLISALIVSAYRKKFGNKCADLLWDIFKLITGALIGYLFGG